MSLTLRQRSFATEYLVDFNGTQAAIRAGYSENGAAQIAFVLLSHAEINEFIQEKAEDRAAAADLSAEWVLRQWRQIASADPNDLIWIRRECCRHCHGVFHAFQWTEFEYKAAVEAARKHECSPKCSQPCSARVIPDPAGGFGFDLKREPAPDCPVCHGEGNERVMVADTRRLRGPARRLYAGAKQTKDGIEIKMRDQDGALANIAKYLGMLVDKRELSGPGGAPIPVAAYSARDLTDDQLAAIAAGRK